MTKHRAVSSITARLRGDHEGGGGPRPPHHNHHPSLWRATSFISIPATRAWWPRMSATISAIAGLGHDSEVDPAVPREQRLARLKGKLLEQRAGKIGQVHPRWYAGGHHQQPGSFPARSLAMHHLATSSLPLVAIVEEQ
jgi:hypothetical protein